MTTQGVNPFRSKPIPKNRIEWAISESRSMRQAAILINVSYNTFKKYADMYGLWAPNEAGHGIPKEKRGRWNEPICNNYGIQIRLHREGIKIQQCDECGYSKSRDFDDKRPIILVYLDKDETNKDPNNLKYLCYNCKFITYRKVKAEQKKTLEASSEKVDSLRNAFMKAFDSSETHK